MRSLPLRFANFCHGKSPTLQIIISQFLGRVIGARSSRTDGRYPETVSSPIEIYLRLAKGLDPPYYIAFNSPKA